MWCRRGSIEARLRPVALAALVATAWAGGALAAPDYPWLTRTPAATVADSFAPPAGFLRAPVEAGSFAAWLRALPLKDTRGVTLHDGRPVTDHGTVAAVIDIDVGRSDLQQCADAVMRLRAEYLFSQRLSDLIGFELTGGERYGFAAYADGVTPAVSADGLAWRQERPRGRDHADLRRWLDIVFGLASTRTLAHELRPVARLADAAIGDVFIRPGHPGHAVIIVDLAVDPANGRKLAILAQSSMPARDMHILRNTLDPQAGPWFALAEGRPVITPGRAFAPNELKRF